MTDKLYSVMRILQTENKIGHKTVTSREILSEKSFYTIEDARAEMHNAYIMDLKIYRNALRRHGDKIDFADNSSFDDYYTFSIDNKRIEGMIADINEVTDKLWKFD